MATPSNVDQGKPGVLMRLLGERMPDSPVTIDGIHPRATWKANNNIQEWGFCWREGVDRRVEIACTVVVKGNTMPGHGNVLSVQEVGEFVHALIRLEPIGDKEGEPDYVAVALPWNLCSEAVCGDMGRAQGMIFEDSHPASAKELMDCWRTMNDGRNYRNKKVADEWAKVLTPPKPRKSEKGKASKPEGTSEGSPAKPKSRAKPKSDKIVLTLEEALVKGNKLTTKTSDKEVDAIYRALEDGLLHAFPYKKRRLPGYIHSDRLHIAPSELKYRALSNERLVQVLRIYKGYGSIRKKPEIYAIPCKRKPTPEDKGLDAVMESMPDESAVFTMESGATIPWWKNNDVHWYIIGGQHTVTACRQLAEQQPEDSDARNELLEFEVIPVFSRDKLTLVRVSNALNLNIAEKAAKENFRSCAELGRAAWKAAGFPEPHRGGGKSSPAFDAAKANVLAYFVEEKGSSKLPLLFVNDTTWNLWMKVFDDWEAGKLIAEDGTVRPEAEEVFSKPAMHITKSDVTTTLGLRDFDLQELARDILAKKVSIKNTAKVRAAGCLTLLDWVRDKKLDRVIMNELMWLKKQHPLPCKDADWVPYTDEAWKDLATEFGYYPDVIRNIWKELRKDKASSDWLDGRASSMVPTTEKSPNGKATDFFHAVLRKFTPSKVTTTIENPAAIHGSGSVKATSIPYECRHAESMEDVLKSLTEGSQIVELAEGSPKMFILFAYTSAGEERAIFRDEIKSIVNMAKHIGADDFIDDGDEDEDNRQPEIPLPMFFIASSRVRDAIISASNRSNQSWTVHTVYYQPGPRCGFKTSDLDAKPLVTVSLSYPWPQDYPVVFPGFKRFTGIQKRLEPFNFPVEGEVDWNNGLCGISHGLLELLLKPSLKRSSATVINIWGGGNITEIALRVGRPVLEFVQTAEDVIIARERVLGMNLSMGSQVLLGGDWPSNVEPVPHTQTQSRSIPHDQGHGSPSVPNSSCSQGQSDGRLHAQDHGISQGERPSSSQTPTCERSHPQAQQTQTSALPFVDLTIPNRQKRMSLSPGRHVINLTDEHDKFPMTPGEDVDLDNIFVQKQQSEVEPTQQVSPLSPSQPSQSQAGSRNREDVHHPTSAALVVPLQAPPASEVITRLVEAHVVVERHEVEMAQKIVLEGTEKALVSENHQVEDEDLIGGQPMAQSLGRAEPRRGRSKGKRREGTSSSYNSHGSTGSKEKSSRQKRGRGRDLPEREDVGDIADSDLPNERLSPLPERHVKSKRQRTSAELLLPEAATSTGSRDNSPSESGGDSAKQTQQQGDRALSHSEHEVGTSKFFLILDINGTLLYYEPMVMKNQKVVQKGVCRFRPGLKTFLRFCIEAGFEIVFWSSVTERNLEPRFQSIRIEVPELSSECLRFSQSMCDESAYRDPANPSRPYFLKSLARLLGSSKGLLGKGATIQNCLLIDDSPYKNILNDPYSAIHPPTCTKFSEMKLKSGQPPFLQKVMIPFLQGLLTSGLTVTEYCEANSKVGQPRCFQGSEMYNRFIKLAPNSQTGHANTQSAQDMEE